MSKILIGTNNKNKVAEISRIIKDKFDEIYTPADLNINVDPDETGSTLEENALIKAREFSKHVDMPVICDDTGLCVHALNNEPGINTARYAGNHDSKANRQKLLQNLANKQDRTAHFETVAVIRYPDGKEFVAFGKVEGVITEKEAEIEGFGYECIFFSTEIQKVFSMVTTEEKNSVSHRGRAVRNLLEIIG